MVDELETQFIEGNCIITWSHKRDSDIFKNTFSWWPLAGQIRKVLSRVIISAMRMSTAILPWVLNFSVGMTQCHIHYPEINGLVTHVGSFCPITILPAEFLSICSPSKCDLRDGGILCSPVSHSLWEVSLLSFYWEVKSQSPDLVMYLKLQQLLLGTFLLLLKHSEKHHGSFSQIPGVLSVC